MKFAMIPINRRLGEDGTRIVRRILISYTRKVKGVYKGCEVIAKDPYFSDPSSSHQYMFNEEGFQLIRDCYGFDTSVFVPYQYDAGRLLESAIEFQADTVEEATEQFNNRDEAH